MKGGKFMGQLSNSQLFQGGLCFVKIIMTKRLAQLQQQYNLM
jgi:hypothetical protein